MDSRDKIEVSDPEDDDLSYRSVSPLTPVVSPAGISSACASLGMHDPGLSVLPTVVEEPENLSLQEQPKAGRSGTSPERSSATHASDSLASPEIASPEGPYDWSYWRRLPSSGPPVTAASDQYSATTGILDARSSGDNELKLYDLVPVHGGDHGSGKRPTEASSPVTEDPDHTLRDSVSHGHHTDESEVQSGVNAPETIAAPTQRLRDRNLTAIGSKGEKVYNTRSSPLLD